VTVSQADRLEAYEAFASLNHKFDLLAVTMTGLERAISTLANWNQVMFAMVLSLNVATFVLILQMR
jgi:hypothetical protein